MAENEEKTTVEEEKTMENPENPEKEMDGEAPTEELKKEDAPGQDSDPKSKEKDDSLEKHMKKNQKDKSVQQKVSEDMAKQKERKSLLAKIWGLIKHVVKEVASLIASGIARIIYGKAAVQDIEKMEEMMSSPINKEKVQKEKKEPEVKKEKEVEKEKAVPEKEKEQKQEQKIEKKKDEIVKVVEDKDREITELDKKCQEFFNKNENKQPFQDLIRRLGFEYENNPEKPGVITIVMPNGEGKAVKCDINLIDIINKPNIKLITETLNTANYILPVHRDEQGKIQSKNFIDKNELLFKTAILSAGLNQIMGGKETSFEFEAYNQNLKMEITHTETNDYAKIIDEKGKEHEVFKPNGTESFIYNSTERIQESLYSNMMDKEAQKALDEMKAFEEEQARKNSISYKIEQMSSITNPEKNAWDDQFDKILNGESSEEIKENDEIIVEPLEVRNENQTYDVQNEDDISI